MGIFVIIIALGALGGSRILGHYRENDLRDLNTRINVGPAKGIITTQINAHNYSEMLAVANRACENSYSLAVEIYYPLAYLSQKCRMHAYTTGRIAISSNRLDLWYEVHHYALPDTVIVYKNKYNQWQWNDDTDTDGFLGNSISSIDLFEKKETPYADIYIKKQ